MSNTPPSPGEGVSVPSLPDGYRNVPVAAPEPDLHVPGTRDDAFPDGDITAVDFPMLNRAIEEAGNAVEVAARASAILTSAVRRSGPAPWGDDPALGLPFGEAFSGSRDVLVRSVSALPHVFENIAGKLAETNSGFHGAQEETLTRVAAVGPQAEPVQD
ncbi:hypothetical protein [Streptomyces sp. NPDC001068]|uniref:hypothetical protein n=1 Tax=Streptomyces sp. NPDC001068 TaxID=3364544 RepID=UPI0036CDB308